MKRLLGVLVLALAPVWAWADTDDFVLGVFRLERCAFMSSSETARADRVDQCRAILDEVLGAYEQLQQAESPQLMEGLRDHWNTLLDIYERGLDMPMLFRDHYTADEIRANRIALMNQLGDRLPKPPNPMALAVLAERTASEYIWRAESTLSAGMTSTEVLDLETMVMDMDKQFEVLLKHRGRDAGLRQAHTRYQFIRGSLLNYNTDMVPYLVDRYVSDITDSLRHMERNKS